MPALQIVISQPGVTMHHLSVSPGRYTVRLSGFQYHRKQDASPDGDALHYLEIRSDLTRFPHGNGSRYLQLLLPPYAVLAADAPLHSMAGQQWDRIAFDVDILDKMTFEIADPDLQRCILHFDIEPVAKI